MSTRSASWRHVAAISTILLLGACAHTPLQAAASHPAAVQASAPIWYHVNFGTNSFAIGAGAQKAIAAMTAYLQRNPESVATIVGRTDTVGSADYNMHLSHKRADAVRDALVYGGPIAADRVETRWSGGTRQTVATADDVASAQNRVVDIAIH